MNQGSGARRFVQNDWALQFQRGFQPTCLLPACTNRWYYSPGVPHICSIVTAVEKTRKRFYGRFSPLVTSFQSGQHQVPLAFESVLGALLMAKFLHHMHQWMFSYFCDSCAPGLIMRLCDALFGAYSSLSCCCFLFSSNLVKPRNVNEYCTYSWNLLFAYDAEANTRQQKSDWFFKASVKCHHLCCIRTSAGYICLITDWLRCTIRCTRCFPIFGRHYTRIWRKQMLLQSLAFSSVKPFFLQT